MVGGIQDGGREEDLLPPGERTALFLDVDGTLVEIAPTPDAVQVSPQLPDLLTRLSKLLDGALVVVSGRSIEQIDQLLAPADLPAAGLHGLQMRDRIGATVQSPVVPPQMAQAKQALQDFVAAHPGTLFEDKAHSIALHYRLAQEAEAAAREITAAVCESLGAHYHVLAGKMVFEIKPDGANKGRAVAHFMGLSLFQGRKPVFIGDDVTDEDGFAVVNRLGGRSIRIGDPAAPTCAQNHIATVRDLHTALDRYAKSFVANNRKGLP
ncbi:trehalose-phosphatase [Magnetospira thiophila]